MRHENMRHENIRSESISQEGRASSTKRCRFKGVNISEEGRASSTKRSRFKGIGSWALPHHGRRPTVKFRKICVPSSVPKRRSLINKNIKPRPGTTRTKAGGENKHEQSSITCGVVQSCGKEVFLSCDKGKLCKTFQSLCGLFLAGEAGKERHSKTPQKGGGM